MISAVQTGASKHGAASTSPGAAALQTALSAKTPEFVAKAKQLEAQGLTPDPELRAAFDSFVGETFYGQMLSSMRKMNHKAAYIDGGRAEEVFRGQLDQTLATEMTKASAHSFTGPMFDLFMLNRR